MYTSWKRKDTNLSQRAKRWSFVGYELGSKNRKAESWKGKNCTIPEESDNESDSLALDLINLGQSTHKQWTPEPTTPKMSLPPLHIPEPSNPLRAPSKYRGKHHTLPDVDILAPPAGPSHYQLQPRPTKEPSIQQTGISTGEVGQRTTIWSTCSKKPHNCTAIASNKSAKWLTASWEEFQGLTSMGIWKLVNCPKDKKNSV